MWTWRVVRGKCGRSNLATWVEYIMLPFGFRMAIGIVAVHLLMMGKSVVQKCAVLPVSAMMEDSRDGVGGPTDLDANATSLQSDCFLGNGFVTFRWYIKIRRLPSISGTWVKAGRASAVDGVVTMQHVVCSGLLAVPLTAVVASGASVGRIFAESM